MSTNAIWTTFCDSTLGDPTYPQSEVCRGWASQEETSALARKAAKEMGWLLGVGDLPDLCFMCAPPHWCPQCGARGSDHCATTSGRDHRARARR